MLDVKRSKVSKPNSSKKQQIKTSNSKNQQKSLPSLHKALESELSAQTTESSTTTKTTKSTPSKKSKSAKMPPSSAASPQLDSTATPAPTPASPNLNLNQLLRPLASSTPSLRRKALTDLLTHLRSSPSRLTKTQALQIHRALYVALYMHDSKSAVSVQNLARTIAGTLRLVFERDLRRRGEDGETRDAETSFDESALWASAFWESMAREWVGVDQWRMNKVLMLVRFWVVESVALVGELAGLETGGTAANDSVVDDDNDEDGDESHQPNPITSAQPPSTTAAATASWQDFLADVTALPLDPTLTLPDGLRMHVLDVWGDEVETLSSSTTTTTTTTDETHPRETSPTTRKAEQEVLKALLVPVKELSVFHDGAEVPNMPKNVRQRAKEVLGRAV